MPELPEVEVVRLGLAEHVTGRTVAAAGESTSGWIWVMGKRCWRIWV
jgi:formamidopyrimidine-DNA glycosylase